MVRALAISLFATAAVASALASTGVAIPAHRMPPGTPADHAMPLGAYRLAFLVDTEVAEAPLSPAMTSLHQLLASAGIPIPEGMHGQPSGGPFFHTSQLSRVSDLGLTLALLAVFLPRLGRPSRRPLETVVVPLLLTGRLAPAPILGPPRI